MQQAGSVKPKFFDMVELKRQMDEYASLSPEERRARLAHTENELRALRAAEKQARRVDALDVSGIPAAFLGRTLAELEQHEENVDALVGARGWQADAENNVNRGRGMLLIGPPGVAKTHIVCVLAQEAVKRASRPITVRYLNWTHMVIKGNRDWRQRDTEIDIALMKADADLLIIDEIGGAVARDSWDADAMLELLDKRMYGGRTPRAVLATTNKRLTEMEATIGGRQWSRLKGLAPEIYGIAGRDYRG